MLLIADTSVLINFLNADRMYLIGRHVPRCVITGHVIDEITDLYPVQRQRLDAAIAEKYLEVVTANSNAEIETFARLQETKRLGVGEASAIAVALRRGYALAIDDRRAILDALALAEAEGVALTILRTQDIIVRLVRAGQLTVEQADLLLVLWRSQHRFHLNIRSFSELL